MSTLTEARADFLEQLGKGGKRCPCCDRFGRRYSYAISNNTIRKLYACADLTSDGSFTTLAALHEYDRYLQGITLSTGHFTFLRFIDLIEKREEGDEDEGAVGWRITPKGKAFLEGSILIPKKLHVYANRIQGVSEETVSVHNYARTLHALRKSLNGIEENQKSSGISPQE